MRLVNEHADTKSVLDAVGKLQVVAADGSLEDLRNEVHRAAEQLNTLRSAFDATMRDQQFLDEAEKLRIEIAPLPGDKVQELVQKLHGTPKDIVERARQAIRP